MSHYKKKLTEQQVKEIELLKGKESYVEIAKKYGVSPSGIQYYLSKGRKQKIKLNSKKWNNLHKEKAKNFFSSIKGKKCVAKSWIRNYLNKKILTINEIEEILTEFKTKGNEP